MKKSISPFYPERKNLWISINIMITGLLFTGFNGIAYAGDIHKQNTVEIQCSYSGPKAGADLLSVPVKDRERLYRGPDYKSAPALLHLYGKNNLTDTTVRKTNRNFYKTDSIFSFRSPKGYFPSLLNNFGQQAVSPFKLSLRQWLMTAGAAGITITLLHFDGEIDEWARVQKQKHSWVNKTSPVITNFGGPWGVYSVLATGVISAVCSKEKGVQTALLATQAMITSGVWANIVKVLTGRERPMADYAFSKSEGGAWYGPFAAWDQDLAVRKPISAFDAFPSGHTATAFSIATVFATQYSDRKVVPVIFYSAATLVGISRLTEHEHWASDVFVGGLLGYLCGKQVVNHYNKTHQDNTDLLSSKSKNKTEFSFIQNGSQIGFSLKW